MADITEISLTGEWRVVVTSRSAGWDQRVRCSNTAVGTETLQGVVGGVLVVRSRGSRPWTLRIEHNDGTGWQANWLKPSPRAVVGSQITQLVRSEDITTANSDRDFDDLVIRLEKVGMVDQPTRPFAVWPTTMQMMPDGIFEASLGRYFLAVTVRNVWSQDWPAGTHVGVSPRCRAWLSAAGVRLIDEWAADDRALFGQEISGGRVSVGALGPWRSRIVYFKVDVADAVIGKHSVEIETFSAGALDPAHGNRLARGPAFVSRTTFDAANQLFVSETDRGRLIASVRELTVDYHSFKRAIARARELFGDRAVEGDLVAGGDGRARCRDERDRIRRELRRALAGEAVDLCALWRQLACCCTDVSGTDGRKPWGGEGATGMEFVSFPTIIDYRVEYAPAFAGQFGPLPFDDPWWKVVLIIIAIILTIAAAASAAADLANRSSDVVIGQVTRSVLNAPPDTDPVPPTLSSTDPGSVDAAVVALNGSRSLTAAQFSFLDAAAGEPNTTPIAALGGTIDTAGATLSNAQLDQIFQDLMDRPDDPAAHAAVQVFKSGARTGLTLALMTSVQPVNPRREHDGSLVNFLNQVRFGPDPAASMTIGRPGDSGSLWLQRGSNAIVALHHGGCSDSNTAMGSRIEDVTNAMNIRFG